MTSDFQIGCKVKIKDTASENAGKEGMIVRLGLGRAKDVTDIGKANSWVILVDNEQLEVPERELELIEESRL